MNVKQKLKLLGVIILAIVSVVIVINKPIKLGLDLQGGSRLVLECQDTQSRKVDDQAVIGALEVIRNRIDGLGITEPVIQRKGQEQIIIEMPGVKDPERAIKLIGETAMLEFARADVPIASEEVLASGNRLTELYGTNSRLAKYDIYDRRGNLAGQKTIILKETVLTGADLKFAGIGYDSYGAPMINIEFTAEGGNKFYNVTEKDTGKPLAIILDGKIISAPNINEPIRGGKAQITGKFTMEEATDLVIKLKAGSLPVPVTIVSNQTIGPSLGQDSVDKSKIAGIWSLFLVAIFMIIYYRLPGLLASLALLLYAFLVSALFSLGNFTLTLPGIAGFIITLGMAVDANILIFERLKEELHSGKNIRMAIEAGFSRAFLTIFDANITTIIAVLPLLWLGTGTIKGFAVVMVLGILVSMFSAIVVTRVLMEALVGTELIKNKFLVLQ
ncbi:MAG: protein translocase subunit SecD [Candidatus Margulisiibacteriota bacterium]